MKNTVEFNLFLNTLRQQGNLTYEYNPFYNYQTDVDLCKIDDTYIVPRDCAVNIKTGDILTKLKTTTSGTYYIDLRGKEFFIKDPKSNVKDDDSDFIKEFDEKNLFATAGSIIDLDTDKLGFDLEHPVDIEVQPSYDGSVNLILNDNKNIPRLINSRFSVREKNTYEIVDRIGENDTNIYNSKNFEKDSALYFQQSTIASTQFVQLTVGNLPVGQYCFYFSYCDSDGNESDIIDETGVIPVFIGADKMPLSMEGGIKNQNSNKGILLQISNLDVAYKYVKVRYVRFFADYRQNRVYEGKEIIKKYEISDLDTLFISITGTEQTEDFDPNILNITKFNPQHILTQAQCKNMLFMGNVSQLTDNYKELSDISLRIIPCLAKQNLDTVTNSYQASDPGYYSSENMYNKVGYFNQEFYSFGIVYIYNNGTLSNVYPTLGLELKDDGWSPNLPSILEEEKTTTGETIPGLIKRNYIPIDNQGWIDINNSRYLNSKGVCKINTESSYQKNTVFNIKFTIPKEVSEYLIEKLNIRGYFFVRQKRTPNCLAQGYLLPFDEQLKAPILETGLNNKKYYTECFVTQKKTITEQIPAPRLLSSITGRTTIDITTTIAQPKYVSQTYEGRLREYSKSFKPSNHCYALICPDFLLNQPYYNQIFNSSEFYIRQISDNSELVQESRLYKETESVNYNDNSNLNKVTLCSVTEDVPTVAINDKIYKLEKGKAEEAFRFEYAEVDTGTYSAGDDSAKKTVNDATNIVRGWYSPFVAVYSENSLQTGQLYAIYQTNSLNLVEQFNQRMYLSEPYYAISQRNSLIKKDVNINCFRGDCYINTFTYRLNRNFNDPSLPNNDDIIDEKTWIDNYDAFNSGKWNKISLSDLNGLQMGSWITFKCRSSINYALRSVDHSYVSEEALMGAPRSFYPKSQLFAKGENKLPESYLYNDAYRTTVGYKCYYALQDVNYIKNNFSNRIQYSAIAIQDSFKNNYRDSLSTYHRDYSIEYGSIQKLVSFEGYLLVIMEHGIGLAVINERILAGQGDGNPVFINTQNVLPEELTIITDTIGTQWPESVIKTESGYVYGVDTVSKKIWRVKGQQLEIISDFKVNKFLIDNISLGERELYPTIGLKNIKTHYNNNKKDVMFTFYDDVYKDEEKVWNLCFNELLNEFVTFYSWVPSYSENIDTQFFTFNRNTSKWLSLLARSNYNIPTNHGIVLDSPVCNLDSLPIVYYSPQLDQAVTIKNQDGTTKLLQTQTKNQNIILPGVKFNIEKDHWQNYKCFSISESNRIETTLENDELKKLFKTQKVVQLYITPYYEYTIPGSETIQEIQLDKTQIVAFTLSDIVNNSMLTDDEQDWPALSTDFYLHGQAGIFNVAENLYPTYWYGETHPFEFEFVVNDKIAQQKIFNNLVIVANKVEPESFHFEIEGDNYEFSYDKRTMYFRQEATKNLYQNLGSDILYNRKYTDIVEDKYTQEQYYRGGDNYKYDISGMSYPVATGGLVQQKKSTIFPLYYNRIDTYNEIYDIYREMIDKDSNAYDFKNLSGSEIKWYRDLNQFNIVTHIKNSPIDLVGILRGNSFYKEGTWNVQIPSIIFNQANEYKSDGTSKWIDVLDDLKKDGPLKDWDNKIPPIVINTDQIPDDLDEEKVTVDRLPNIYQNGYWTKSITTTPWTSRKEVKIRDKWMKVRIRYSGKNLAIIHSIMTLFNISYN